MPCARVQEFARQAFMAAGVPPEDAALCAEILVSADRRGISSHGIGRLTGHYLDRIKSGIQSAATHLELVKNSGATCVIDGHGGMGMVIARHAMANAIGKAKDYGIGIAVVRNSSHFGIAGYYSEMAVKAGCIGICGTNARPSVAPTFSTQNVIGTNPLACAMPSAEDFPFSYDGSTCVSQRGKVELYARLGKALPPGWVIGIDGNTRSDTEAVIRDFPQNRAALVPLGGIGETGAGYKGYGFGMIVELLSSALQQGAFLSALSGLTDDGRKRSPRTGHFFIAIDVEHFTDLESFKRTVAAATAECRAARKAPGCDRIYTAGEKEYYRTLETGKSGIALNDALRRMMCRVKRDYKLDFELPFEEKQ